MLSVISPAKTLDFETSIAFKARNQPVLLDQSERVMNTLKKKSVNKLMDLQAISKNLAELNYERNQIWSVNHTEENTRPSMFAFKGDVYLGLDALSFDAKEVEFAEEHLRILSGLYGVLRPLDGIQPYRLEMGTALKTTRGKNIVEFWKQRVNKILEEELNNHNTDLLLNLASDEYFNVIKNNGFKPNVIQPVFMDKKNGKYKVISFFAKKARGMMARFIIKHGIDEVEEIKAFDTEGYAYNKELSTDDKWVFTRDQE